MHSLSTKRPCLSNWARSEWQSLLLTRNARYSCQLDVNSSCWFLATDSRFLIGWPKFEADIRIAAGEPLLWLVLNSIALNRSSALPGQTQGLAASGVQSHKNQRAAVTIYGWHRLLTFTYWALIAAHLSARSLRSPFVNAMNI